MNISLETFWYAFWLIVSVFFFFAYIVVLFQIISDLFRDRTLGGFAKAVWVFFLILTPMLAALIYLVARGRGMGERQVAAVSQAREETERYIRDAAGTSPAQQIESAKALLDSGAISADEFARLKAAALAKV